MELNKVQRKPIFMQNIENHMNTNNNNNANPFHIAYNLWRHYKAQKININQDELLTIDQLWTVKKFFLALLLTVRKILTKKTAQQWEEEEEKIIFISQKFSLSLDFFLFLFFLMIAAAPKNMFSLTRNIFQTFASRISWNSLFYSCDF